MQLDDPTLLRTQAFVDGAWIDADHAKSFPVVNPATGETIAEVPELGVAETRRAIEAAQRAFGPWRARTGKERGAVLRRWFDRLLAHAADLAVLMVTEQGKPLAEARGEVSYGAAFVEWFAEEAKRLYGDAIPTVWPDKRLLVLKEPVGVCAAITPWNFPLAMITRKIAPALAAGCTVVAKPAEQTPLCALALAELAARAELPPGVLNVVTGDPVVIGGELASNSIVRKLSFTGSTEVGKLLMRQCAGTLKKLSLELGGNAPFIVFDDADLDAAVEGAVVSKYRNSGQTCVCANRFLVQDGVYEEFTARLGRAVGRLEVGDGLQPGVSQGPLIDHEALRKVEAHVADARARGARVVIGGRRHSLGGTFYEPTVLADADTSMRLAREETFGPVAPLFRFTADDDAVRMANDTEYGLAAYLYSRDHRRIWRTLERLEYGMIGVNTGTLSTEVAPFGGVKESGIGREGSRYGIEEYVELKYVALGGL